MILITTAVANFTVDRVSRVMSMPNQLAWAQRYGLRNPDDRIEVFNDAGVMALGVGPKDIVPSVWSHTPFTYGMDPEALQAKFEERAAVVLSDWNEPVNFSKVSDGRYLLVPVRTAWMMYVDQAIEHFNQ